MLEGRLVPPMVSSCALPPGRQASTRPSRTPELPEIDLSLVLVVASTASSKARPEPRLTSQSVTMTASRIVV